MLYVHPIPHRDCLFSNLKYAEQAHEFFCHCDFSTRELLHCPSCQSYLESYLNDFILDLLIYLLRMSTTEQSSTHVSLSIPLDQPPPSDNFQFMSDTFTLPQDGHSGPTQTASSQGYAG